MNNIINNNKNIQPNNNANKIYKLFTDCCKLFMPTINNGHIKINNIPVNFSTLNLLLTHSLNTNEVVYATKSAKMLEWELEKVNKQIKCNSQRIMITSNLNPIFIKIRNLCTFKIDYLNNLKNCDNRLNKKRQAYIDETYEAIKINIQNGRELFKIMIEDFAALDNIKVDLKKIYSLSDNDRLMKTILSLNIIRNIKLYKNNFKNLYQTESQSNIKNNSNNKLDSVLDDIVYTVDIINKFGELINWCVKANSFQKKMGQLVLDIQNNNELNNYKSYYNQLQHNINEFDNIKKACYLIDASRTDFNNLGVLYFPELFLILTMGIANIVKSDLFESILSDACRIYDQLNKLSNVLMIVKLQSDVKNLYIAINNKKLSNHSYNSSLKVYLKLAEVQIPDNNKIGSNNQQSLLELHADNDLNKIQYSNTQNQIDNDDELQPLISQIKNNNIFKQMQIAITAYYKNKNKGDGSINKAQIICVDEKYQELLHMCNEDESITLGHIMIEFKANIIAGAFKANRNPVDQQNSNSSTKALFIPDCIEVHGVNNKVWQIKLLNADKIDINQTLSDNEADFFLDFVSNGPCYFVGPYGQSGFKYLKKNNAYGTQDAAYEFKLMGSKYRILFTEDGKYLKTHKK